MRAVLAVTRELVLMCWSIGQDILDRQQAEDEEPSSLNGLRDGAEKEIVQQAIAQLAWGDQPLPTSIALDITIGVFTDILKE
jgi:hypothetical protein